MTAHRKRRRIILPNGAWLNLFEDGTARLSTYRHKVTLREILTRVSGAHVDIELNLKADRFSTFPTINPSSDYVVVPASELTKQQRDAYFGTPPGLPRRAKR